MSSATASAIRISRSPLSDAAFFERIRKRLEDLGLGPAVCEIENRLPVVRRPDGVLLLADLALRPVERSRFSRSGSCFAAAATAVPVVWLGNSWELSKLELDTGFAATREFFVSDSFSDKQISCCISEARAYFGQEHQCLLAHIVRSDSVLEHLDNGLLICDRNGAIVYANGAACRLIGMPYPLLMYADLDEILKLVDLRTDGIASAMGSNKEWCTLIRSDGTSIPIEKTEGLLAEKGQDEVFTLISIRDNSAETRYLEQIENSRRVAELASSAKNDFLAHISHELRTPLNSILGMTDLAREISQSPEQLEYLNILRRSGDSLLDLISSMLDYVKLESGTFKIKERSFQVSALIDSLCADFSLQCHGKGLSLYVQADPDVPAEILGDETRIKQVATNLLSNAVKFTDRGEIVLGIHLVSPIDDSPGPSERKALEISVRDTGIGISKDKIWEIFQPFVQVEAVQNHNRPGTGIGLSISKMIVEAMGGRIRAQSEPGKGSVFSFTVWLKSSLATTLGVSTKPYFTDRYFILLGENGSWADSVTPWLQYLHIEFLRCSTISELETTLDSLREKRVVLFVHGIFSESRKVCEALLGRDEDIRCLVSLRVNRSEDSKWLALPFPYKQIREPLRIEETRRSLELVEGPAYPENSLSQARELIRVKGLVLEPIGQNGKLGDIIEDLRKDGLLRESHEAGTRISISDNYFIFHGLHSGETRFRVSGNRRTMSRELLLILARLSALEERASKNAGSQVLNYEELPSLVAAVESRDWDSAILRARSIRSTAREALDEEVAGTCFRLVLALRARDLELSSRLIRDLETTKGVLS